MTRPPIHHDLSEKTFNNILQVYADSGHRTSERLADATDQLVIATQLWDLFEQRYPELAAEHRAAVDTSLALGRAIG